MTDLTLAPEEKTETPKNTIPKDLADKWGACQATATIFNLLRKGQYPFEWFRAVEGACQFAGKLHEQTVEDCLKHPDAHLIPELKAELEKMKTEGTANGETKSH